MGTDTTEWPVAPQTAGPGQTPWVWPECGELNLARWCIFKEQEIKKAMCCPRTRPHRGPTEVFCSWKDVPDAREMLCSRMRAFSAEEKKFSGTAGQIMAHSVKREILLVCLKWPQSPEVPRGPFQISVPI